jgi:hypothetical protein
MYDVVVNTDIVCLHTISYVRPKVLSLFRVTPCCHNHPWTPSHAVGIWAVPFEQHEHPVGLVLGEQRWEIRFFCRSSPDKMAMVARHTEGQWTH